MDVPKSVDSSDSIHIAVSGVKSAGKGSRQSGTPTMIVNELFNLGSFLGEYGSGVSDPVTYEEVDWKLLAKTDPAKFAEEWAKYGAVTAGQVTAKALPDQIVDAVCNYLTTKKGVVISNTDPGSDVWYVSRSDLQPTVMKHPQDGYQWLVAMVAPFGFSL